MLEHEVLDREGTARRLLVLVHGYAQDPDELRRRVERFDPNGEHLVVLPTAPFTWKGQSIWHRPFSGGSDGTEQFLASMCRLDELLGHLEARHDLAAGEAIVGGFSQGGGLSLALHYLDGVVHRPAAAFGVCSFPLPIPGLRVDAAAAAGAPAFLSLAQQDRFAPIEMCRAGADCFRMLGLDLTVVETSGGHELDDEVADDVGRWLAARPSGPRRPQPPRLAPGPIDGFGVPWTVV